MASFSLNSATTGISGVQASLNSNNPITQAQQASYQAGGFLANATPSADGNGLPFSKITANIPVSTPTKYHYLVRSTVWNSSYVYQPTEYHLQS